MKYDSVIDLIGNTPLVKMSSDIHGLKNIDLYAKLEMNNPFGSLKDRISWGIIKDDIEEISKEKKTLIESSSGNTAKALAILAAMYGVELTTITNRINVPEVKKILQVIGANIEELPGLSECPDFTDPNNPIAYIEKKMAQEPDKYYHTSQYTNEKNYLTHFETTGPEIIKDLGSVDYFIATLGTTGSSRGTAEYLRQVNPETQTVGVISTKDDFIPGIRNVDETMEVGMYNKGLYDSTQVVNSIDSLESMRLLIQRAGILAGPTSGASYEGSLQYLKEIDSSLAERKTAVFVVCDRFEWYLSYIEKRKPEWFGFTPKPSSIRAYDPPNDTSFVDLEVGAAEDWIKTEEPLIVDVRGALGFRAGHIAGSINILDKQLVDMLDDGIPFSKNQKLLFVCPSGDISRRFASFLQEKGHECKSLAGGLLAWRQAGKSLERS